MSIYLRIPVAIDLLFTAVEHLSPSMMRSFLPLGGSAFVQLAALLLLGVAAHELFADRKAKRSK